jgi:hypothetical protein
MRDDIEKLINVMNDSDIPILFGDGAKIVVDGFNFSDYQGIYYVSLKLVDCNPELAVDVFPEALEILFHDIWVCLPTKYNYILTTSMNH